MLRDLTMIFSVLVSVASLLFGVYKNIEAGNARGFAYEQAYRIMGVVREANIAPAAKANILDTALGMLSAPPPVIDLSRSSADAPADPQACLESLRVSCIQKAGDLAALNAVCMRSTTNTDACAQASVLKADIDAALCITCFMN
jgi:hypothetical protein